ncbi:MAG TPA: membrane protein insertase YidC, partial [Gammaproteobacteria bacterium]|nr:membrane protein insertase YidC [Gammaproteobacteria bacterium]
MDNRRMFLLAALGLVGYLIFNAWMQDYGPNTPPAQSQQQAEAATSATPSSRAIPEPAAPAPGAATPAANSEIVGAAPLAHGQDVTITTDTMRVVV